MKLRMLSLLLAAALLAGLVPAVFAEEVTPALIPYPVEGGNLYFNAETQTIEEADEGITAIDLPAEINGVAVKVIRNYLFYNNTTLRSVKLAAGLELIDESAFSTCTALENVTILGVKTIGNAAFCGCTKLKNLTIAGVETINLDAFACNPALETLTLPAGTKSAGSGAFRDCTSLTTVQLPDGLLELDATFYGCTSLETLPKLPRSLTHVDGSTFQNTAAWNDEANWTDDLFYHDGWLLGSRNDERDILSVAEGTRGIADSALRDHAWLSTVTLPESLEYIGNWAFYSDASIRRLVFKSKLKGIGDFAFENCSALRAACFNGDLPALGRETFWRNGSNYVTNEKEYYPLKELTLYYYPERTGWATVTEYVTAPWDGGVIPSGYITKKIDGGELNFNMETGEVESFTGTLTHLELPEKINGSYVRRIKACVFEKQTELTTVTLPESLFVLGNGAFKNCTALRSIKLPKRMQSLGHSLFEGCTVLQTVILPEGPKELPAYLLKNCESLNYVSIPEGVTFIGMEAFRGCKLLSRLVLPDSLTGIGNEAFGGCSSLETLVLPPHLEYFRDYCFASCTSLTSVTIPASVKNLAWFGFEGCTALEAVYFLGDAPTGGEAAFPNCPKVILFYPPDAEGWSTPTWNYYPAYPYAHVHTFTSQIVSPTCTEQGYTLQRCACGEEQKVDFVAALGHSYENDVCIRCGQRDPDAAPLLEPVRFRDVSEKEWYAEAVAYAVRKGLMNGVGNEKFDPEGTMTRAMLVTVLWREAGKPDAGKTAFTDVPVNEWYTDAVAWAADCGVVNGVGGGKFDPDGAITREQMAAILFRYANTNKIDTAQRGDTAAFPDAGEVSDWAKDALSWTVAMGIIGGTEENGKVYLDPQGNATRAQVAAILMRYLEKIK